MITGAPPSSQTAANEGLSFLAELPLLLVVAAVIAFVLRTLVAQAFYIPSGSMIPQLEINDRVVVSKLAYRAHQPRRSDIVVFDCPPKASCPAHPAAAANPVVRAVHFVGEKVGVVQPSTDDYIKRVIGLPGDTVEGRGGHVYVNGQLLVEPYLKPTVVTSDFQPVELAKGTLWVMGDNRANSADSRVFGPIERRTIVGRAIAKVWPLPQMSYL